MRLLLVERSDGKMVPINPENINYVNYHLKGEVYEVNNFGADMIYPNDGYYIVFNGVDEDNRLYISKAQFDRFANESER